MPDPKDTVFYIPHTHWEGAVFKTRAQYLDMGLPNILRALRLLKRHPNYKFVLDQVCYVKPFLERYPEEEAAFRQFIAEGRLAIVGGTDVMLDVNIPGGESYVRQVLYGKRYFREALGVDVTTGWQLDTFGHHAQMPQLLKLAGFESLWFFRGVSSWDVPGNFLWEGIDGTRIPAFWLPHGYAVTYGSPKTLPEFTRFFEERRELLAPFYGDDSPPGPAGADVCEPEAHVPGLAEELNSRQDAPVHVRIAVPAVYEQLAARNPNRPVITGDMNPIFQGAYSSRIELKQRTRALEQTLTTAEKLGVLLRGLGIPADDKNLWRAWEPMLFNQAHDLMAGVMTDHVYEDTLQSYELSKRIADEEAQTRLRRYASCIDTRGEGMALVVFNPLGWARSDLVAATVGVTDSGVTDLEVLDLDGQPVPSQLMQAERDENGALIQAQIAFVARNVPALGHSVFRVRGLQSAGVPESQDSDQQPDPVVESDHYRVEFSSATGAIESITCKPDGWEALGGPANVVAQEEDHGDLWELYRPLDGGSRIAMTDVHGVPEPGNAIRSDEGPGDPGTLSTGPVFSEFTTTRAIGEGNSLTTTVRVHAKLRRIEIHTRLLNNAQFVRYRALFPTSISDGRSTHEIPFGAIERPSGIEFPAQNWVDHGDGARGVALLNRGIPGNNVADGTMMLSLCRSTCIVAYGFGGGYEPGMGSDSGFELEKELVFDYALVPHSGDWRDAGIHREGMEFNSPLVVVSAGHHAGQLPRRWGALEVSDPQVVVSALKSRVDGTTILRVYEATGQAAHGVSIRLAAKIDSAEEVNLIEDSIGEPVSIEGDRVSLDLGPFEIKTIKLTLGRFGSTGNGR